MINRLSWKSKNIIRFWKCRYVLLILEVDRLENLFITDFDKNLQIYWFFKKILSLCYIFYFNTKFILCISKNPLVPILMNFRGFIEFYQNVGRLLFYNFEQKYSFWNQILVLVFFQLGSNPEPFLKRTGSESGTVDFSFQIHNPE